MLTELEGAILTEVGYRDRRTAFQVRQAFKLSPSSEWQGSAGAVYPAIKRLVDKDLLDAEILSDARGTRRLSLTAAGNAELMRWSLDVPACLSIGADPFRLRAGLWQVLEHGDQVRHFTSMISAVEQAIVSLEQYRKDQDQSEITQVDLAIELQRLRIRWLTAKLGGIGRINHDTGLPSLS